MTIFDQSTPTEEQPPRFLYKYLSVERAKNVLEGGLVRFTPLLNTNDTFEVRSTFEKLIGPKALEIFAKEIEKNLAAESLTETIKEMLEREKLDISPERALDFARSYYGVDISIVLSSIMKKIVHDDLVVRMNDPDLIRSMIEKMARTSACFSLSERMDISPLWAHYADDNAGFVIAFDTQNSWFHEGKGGKKRVLQKVKYFDGKLDEFIDDPQSALVSKTKEWAYEREWRICVKVDEADTVIGNSNDTIHLFKFPPESVNRVILGSKANPELAEFIRQVLASRYPNAQLRRAVPNWHSHTYDEVSA